MRGPCPSPLVPPPHLLPGSATYRHLEVDDGHEDIQRAVELHRVDAVADVGFDQVWACGVVGVHVSLVQLKVNLKIVLIIQ